MAIFIPVTRPLNWTEMCSWHYVPLLLTPPTIPALPGGRALWSHMTKNREHGECIINPVVTLSHMCRVYCSWPTPRSLQPTHRHDNLRPPLSPLLLSSSPPPNSPYLTNRIAHPGSGGLRTPRQQATPTRPSKQLQNYSSPFRN